VMRERFSTALKPLESAIERAVKIPDALKAMFAPASRTAESARVAGMIRAGAGELSIKTERSRALVKDTLQMFDKIPKPEKLAFIDRWESGLPQPTPELQAVEKALKAMLDDRVDQVQKLGVGALEHVIQDYFPHIWERVDEGEKAVGRIYGQ